MSERYRIATALRRPSLPRRPRMALSTVLSDAAASALQRRFSQHRAQRRRYVIDTSQHVVERFAPIRDIGHADPHPRRLFDATGGTVQTVRDHDMTELHYQRLN